MIFERRTTVLALLILASFALSGCAETRNEIKQALGIDKQEIDESEVLTGPPLTLPPDYDLRPPEFGDAEAYAPNPVAPPPQANPYAAPGAPGQQPYAQQPYAQQPYAQGYVQPQGQPQGQPQYYDPNLAAIQNSMSYANQAYQATNQAYQQPYYGQQPYAQQPYAQQPYYTQQPYAQQPYYGQQVAPQPYYGQQQPYAQQPYYGQQQQVPPVPRPPATTLSTSEANPEQCDKIVTDSSGNYVCEE